jgi:hypothetical protein
VVFLNLWTTWCPPSRGDSGQDLAKRMAGEDFVMLAVFQDDGGAAVVKPFVRR